MVWDGMFAKAKCVYVWCACVVYMYEETCVHVSAHALCFGGNVQTVYIPGVCLCVALLWVYIVSVSSPVNCAGVFAHVCWVFMCMFVCLHKCAHVLYVCTCKYIGIYPNQNTEEALAADQYLVYNSFLESRHDRKEFLRARLLLRKS